MDQGIELEKNDFNNWTLFPIFTIKPWNPLIKAFIFSLLAFFGSLLPSGYQKERERRSKPNEEHFLMLNLVVEKGASKDRDQSELNITRPKTGTPIGFVQRYILDFGLGTSPYTVGIFSFVFFFFLFFFFFYCSSLTSSPCASLNITIVVHLSIATTIYFLKFPSYYLYFHLN